ncbi:MAG: hypothetical protein H7A25_10655 [Leptospiraceae bacterium]|nr:hypothetical protein [Leptospiraceae bacterium]MCP5500354.1 hypothetical protein [Leptospiraceae bacterium]
MNENDLQQAIEEKLQSQNWSKNMANKVQQKRRQKQTFQLSIAALSLFLTAFLAFSFYLDTENNDSMQRKTDMVLESFFIGGSYFGNIDLISMQEDSFFDP